MVARGRAPSEGQGTVPDGTSSALALRIADRARLPALVVDPRSREIRTVNEEFLEAFDVEAQTVEGARYPDVVHEDDRWDVRDLLSVLAYGGSSDPLTVRLQLDGDTTETRWIGVPNLVDEPTDPVAVVCRRPGEAGGQPLGPPAFLVDDDEEPTPVPPRERIREDRRMADTSRYLWDRDAAGPGPRNGDGKD